MTLMVPYLLEVLSQSRRTPRLGSGTHRCGRRTCLEQFPVGTTVISRALYGHFKLAPNAEEGKVHILLMIFIATLK